MLRAGAAVAGLLLAAASAGPAVGQTWRSVGPPGGDVRALAADAGRPGRVYLGTADGILYRSDDAGRSWLRLEPGFPLRGRSLDDVLVDRHGDVIVGFWEVEGRGGGVARSRDGGATFELMPGIDGVAVRGLAIAPSGMLVAGTPGGVFRSGDGGSSWQRISPAGHAGLRNVGSVAIQPDDVDVIYAGTWHLPWKTADGGQSWKRVSAGIMSDSDIMTLSLDPADPDRIIATACSGIYRTASGGRRWARLSGIPWSARRTRAFAVSPERPGTYFAGTTEGLWKSDDAAASWRLASDRALVVNAIVALPGGVVLAGCDGAGVLRSDDHGGSFAPSNAGFSARFVAELAFHRRSGRVFAAVQGDRHHSGVLSAPSADGPWHALGPGLEGRKVLCLAVGESLLAVGTDDGIYLAAPGGSPWIRARTVVDGSEAHPRVGALALVDDATLLAATARGLLRSGDGGRSWQRRRLGSAAAVSALAATASGRVLAATALALFQSADGGETWGRLTGAPGGALIERLAILPGSPERVLAATRHGLLKSNDGGRTWRPRNSLPRSAITGLACAADGETVYAADFSYGGLFRSADGGESWDVIGIDGLAAKRVYTVGLEPGAAGRVVAAVPTEGLFVRVPPRAAAAQEGAPDLEGVEPPVPGPGGPAPASADADK